VDTQDWEKEEWDEGDEASNVHDTIYKVIQAGNKAVLNVEG
jgi:hypothetical protein